MLTIISISELLRAAEDIGWMTKNEQIEVLRRAVATIRMSRDELNSSSVPADAFGELRDIVDRLNDIVRRIDRFDTPEIVKAITQAADTIRITKNLAWREAHREA